MNIKDSYRLPQEVMQLIDFLKLFELKFPEAKITNLLKNKMILKEKIQEQILRFNMVKSKNIIELIENIEVLSAQQQETSQKSVISFSKDLCSEIVDQNLLCVSEYPIISNSLERTSEGFNKTFAENSSHHYKLNKSNKIY